MPGHQDSQTKRVLARESLWLASCIVGVSVLISVLPNHRMAWGVDSDGSIMFNLDSLEVMFMNFVQSGLTFGILIYAVIGVLRLMGNWHHLKG